MLQIYFEHFIDIVSENRYYWSLPEDIDINIDAALLLVLLTPAADYDDWRHGFSVEKMDGRSGRKGSPTCAIMVSDKCGGPCWDPVWSLVTGLVSAAVTSSCVADRLVRHDLIPTST